MMFVLNVYARLNYIHMLIIFQTNPICCAHIVLFLYIFKGLQQFQRNQSKQNSCCKCQTNVTNVIPARMHIFIFLAFGQGASDVRCETFSCCLLKRASHCTNSHKHIQSHALWHLLHTSVFQPIFSDCSHTQRAIKQQIYREPVPSTCRFAPHSPPHNRPFAIRCLNTTLIFRRYGNNQRIAQHVGGIGSNGAGKNMQYRRTDSINPAKCRRPRRI